jgi:hypothetical protein
MESVVMCVKEEIDDESKDISSTLSPDTKVCEDTSCKVNLFSELVVFGRAIGPCDARTCFYAH